MFFSASSQNFQTAPDSPGGLFIVLGAFGRLQMPPDGSGQLRAVPDRCGWLQTVPDGSGRLRTAPDGSERFRTAPDGPGRLRTLPDGFRMGPDGRRTTSEINLI